MQHSIFYIGADEGFFTTLSSHELVVARMSKSLVGLLNDRFQPTAIVLDHHLMGTSLQNAVLTIRKKGYTCPIYVHSFQMQREEKILLLKLGIREIVENVDQLLKFLKYQTEFLNLSQEEEERVEKELDYKLPLWKRTFDILFASTVLIMISPILLIIAAAIYIESPGPVFYRSKRVGTGYQIFDFLKFRSMYINADRKLAEMKELNQYESEQEEQAIAEVLKKAETSGEILIGDGGEELSEAEYLRRKAANAGPTFLKIANDPRITKVGRFIRSTSLDELPQFFNVLKGEMSVVGNRPLPLYEAVELTTDQWAARFLAPAGITGLWQVEKRGKSEMSETERKQLDIQYALNLGLRMDLRIILKTIPALLQKENV